MNRSRRILVVVVGIALLAIGSAACGGSTTADTVGLHYGGGTFEGDHYERFIEPGSGRVTTGPSDVIIRIPFNKRDYTFCSDAREAADDPGCDGGPIEVTALGGADIAFEGGLSFVINTATEQSTRTFYEQLCRKFDCADGGGLNSGGWAELLRVNVRAPLEDTLQEVVRGYTVDAIYAGTPSQEEGESEADALSTLTRISDEVQRRMRDTLNEFAGGDFFCGPSFDRTQGADAECPELEFVITEVTPSESVRAAFDANVTSQQGVIDAANAAEASAIEQGQLNANTISEAQAQAEAAAALAGIASVPGIVEYLQAQAMATCAANSNCTLVIGDTGANVNVGPR